MPAKPRIIITGELPLAEEYAVLLSSHGFTVSVRLNTGMVGAKLPKGIAKVKSVPKSAFVALELTNCDLAAKKENLRSLEKALPKKTVIISSSVTVTLAEQESWLKSADRLVGIGALPSLLGGSLIEFTASPSTTPEALERAMSIAASLRKKTAVVRDSIGMVLPRIVCMLSNEACFAMSERVATAHGIDTAMKLGTNYPKGPVEWGDALGADQVFAVMSALHRHFGEERYRPAPLLAAAARKGTFDVL